MNIEDVILGMLDGASVFDFNELFKVIGVSLLIIWFFVVVWVWLDSGERSRSIVFRVFSVLIATFFNLLGLIIYLLIRPKHFVDDDYWTDLERRYLLYETAELNDCESCGFQLRPGFNVCPNCALLIKNECDNCEMLIDKYWPYCPYCSTPQKEFVNNDTNIKAASLITGFSLKNSNKKGTNAKSGDEQDLKSGSKSDVVGAKDQKQTPLNEADKQEIEKTDVDETPVDQANIENADKSTDFAQNQTSNDDLSDQNKVDEKKSVSNSSEAQMIKDDRSNINKEEENIADKKSRKTSNGDDPFSKLGKAVLSGIYLTGEKIHKTALKISGPLNAPTTTTPIDQDGSVEKVAPISNDKDIESEQESNQEDVDHKEIKEKQNKTKKNQKNSSNSSKKKKKNRKKKKV